MASNQLDYNDFPSSTRNRTLIAAIHGGNLGIIQELLKIKEIADTAPRVMNVTQTSTSSHHTLFNLSSSTPLAEAIRCGRKDIVEQLILDTPLETSTPEEIDHALRAVIQGRSRQESTPQAKPVDVKLRLEMLEILLLKVSAIKKRVDTLSVRFFSEYFTSFAEPDHEQEIIIERLLQNPTVQASIAKEIQELEEKKQTEEDRIRRGEATNQEQLEHIIGVFVTKTYDPRMGILALDMIPAINVLVRKNINVSLAQYLTQYAHTLHHAPISKFNIYHLLLMAQLLNNIPEIHLLEKIDTIGTELFTKWEGSRVEHRLLREIIKAFDRHPEDVKYLVYRLLQIYKKQNIPFPEDIQICHQNLQTFFDGYDRLYQQTRESLQFHHTLHAIIDSLGDSLQPLMVAQRTSDPKNPIMLFSRLTFGDGSTAASTSSASSSAVSSTPPPPAPSVVVFDGVFHDDTQTLQLTEENFINFLHNQGIIFLASSPATRRETLLKNLKNFQEQLQKSPVPLAVTIEHQHATSMSPDGFYNIQFTDVEQYQNFKDKYFKRDSPRPM